MWIPEVSIGNATFQEPVQDVEKVPKTRWKLVSYCMLRGQRFIADPLCSPVIYASKRWVHAFNAGTNRASKRFTLLARGKPDYVCE